MNKSIIQVLIIFFTCFINANAQEIDIQSKVDAIAKKYIDKKNTSALVINFYYNGEPFTGYYGETELGNKEKPNANSVFEIGSVSSIFTTILLAKFELNQTLSSDDELKKFLPNDVVLPLYQNLICKPDKELLRQLEEPESVGIKISPYICIPDPTTPPQEIKLCYLASHTAGFPAYPSNFKKNSNRKDPFANYTKDDLYNYLKKYKLKHSLGTAFKFSNTGISLLGHALELYKNETISKLYNDFIWLPLNMTTTSLALNNSDDQSVLKGYSKTGKEAGLYHYKIFAPSLGIRSTPNNMMKFLEANLQIKRNDLSDALVMAQQPRLKIHKRGLKNSFVAMGWFISPIEEGRQMIWQQGTTSGHSCFVGLIKGSKSGVVIMANNNYNLKPMAKEILELFK